MAQKETDTTSKVIGGLIASATPLALMVWGGTETTGVLRWALFGWVAFTVLCIIGTLTAKNVAKA